ncbi:unnamed protein product [Phytophthora lilii]|uniref:Unnamed protein product n=1 Tax=Phytophthora lilii TaxID=2077276 RepID=A0A9W6TTR0_9STRA|nr:unnamed protein product [Phytophthora lilii]
MDHRGSVEEMPRIVEQRCDSSASLGRTESSSNVHRGPDRLRVLEERLDQVQADMQTTHRMLRDLSSLVHRQLQVQWGLVVVGACALFSNVLVMVDHHVSEQEPEPQ